MAKTFTRIPQPPPRPRREFDRLTQRSLSRGYRRAAQALWDGKGDPKLRGVAEALASGTTRFLP